MEISFWDYLPKSAKENLHRYLGGIIKRKLRRGGLSQKDLENVISVSSQELELMMQGKKSWGKHYQTTCFILGIRGTDVFRELKPNEIARFRKESYPQDTRWMRDISLHLQLLKYLESN